MSTQSLCSVTVLAPETWENEGRPRRRVNVNRDLTRSSDFTREGLAMKATRVCSIEGCERDARKRGLCGMHYQRQLTSGEIKRLVIPSYAERIASGTVSSPSGCLEWTGRINRGGYGTLSVDDYPHLAHRLAWEVVNGPIPDGLSVLHHCDNPPCCQTEPTEGYPDGHLFLGTVGENNTDMTAKGRHANQIKTHCSKGHELPEVNAKGHRVCRPCANIRTQAWVERKSQDAS